MPTFFATGNANVNCFFFRSLQRVQSFRKFEKYVPLWNCIDSFFTSFANANLNSNLCRTIQKKITSKDYTREKEFKHKRTNTHVRFEADAMPMYERQLVLYDTMGNCTRPHWIRIVENQENNDKINCELYALWNATELATCRIEKHHLWVAASWRRAFFFILLDADDFASFSEFECA